MMKPIVMPLEKFTLQLNKNDWYNRIMKASRHKFGNRPIIKVHIIREQKSNLYYIYFGQKSDGYYSANIER